MYDTRQQLHHSVSTPVMRTRKLSRASSISLLSTQYARDGEAVAGDLHSTTPLHAKRESNSTWYSTASARTSVTRFDPDEEDEEECRSLLEEADIHRPSLDMHAFNGAIARFAMPAVAEESSMASASGFADDIPPSRPISLLPATTSFPNPVPNAELPRQTSLTLLLVNGNRRTIQFDPGTSAGRVKEILWSSWTSEWEEERPPAPAQLRLVHLGRVLQDSDCIDGLRPLPLVSISAAARPPPIVHLSICRIPTGMSEDAPGGKRSFRRRMRNIWKRTRSRLGDGLEVLTRGCFAGFPV